MPPRALIRRWPLWVRFVGLLVLACAGGRSARASTCHVLDRPTLGLQAVDLVPVRVAPLALLTTAPIPGYRHVPCSDDPAARPDHSSHLVGWIAPPSPTLHPPRSMATTAPHADLRPELDRGTRLDRPPRPA